VIFWKKKKNWSKRFVYWECCRWIFFSIHQ